MRWKKVHLFVALALILVLLFAVVVYALTSVVYTDQVDFDSGQYNATNFTSGRLHPIDFNYILPTSDPLGDNQSESSLVNMSGNYLLSRFNETSADTLAGSEDFSDSSGQGYHGEDYGTVGYGTVGVYGSAVDLTSNGAIDFGDIEMSTWTEFSMSVWINRTGGSGTQRIASKDRAGVVGNWILWFDGNTLKWQIRDGANWRIVSFNPDSNGIDGDWHHVAVTVDTVDNQIELFWDGQSKGTDVFNAASLDDSDNEEVVVGADSRVGTFSHYFTGYVDEFAIWDRELSSVDISNIYTSFQGFVAADEYLYESAVEDAGSSTDWQSFARFQEFCYECPLPNMSRNETSSWFNRTIDMDQTMFLFHFDESSLDAQADSTDFYDAGGNYFHANESDGVTLAPGEGLFDGTVNLTGTEEIIVGNLNYSEMTELSMGVWLRTTSTGTMRIMSSDEQGVYGNYILYIDGDSPRFLSRSGVSSWFDISNSTTINDGEWHHIVGVLDSNNDMMYLYLDGKEAASTAYTQDPLYFPSTYETVIGADSDIGAHDHNFVGSLDEVFMLAQALTAEEIEAMYYRGQQNPFDFQIQSCNDAACSGESYTSFSGESPIDISSLTDNQYIQFFTNMTRFSYNGSYGPSLYNFTLTDEVLAADAVESNGQAWQCQGCRAASEDPGAGVPTAINLSLPVNATSGTDRAFQFIWNNSDTTNVTYDLQISTDYNFGSTVVSVTGLSEENATQTNYTSSDLAVDDIYYWRVRAVNGITPGDWSEVRELEVLSYLAISLPETSGVDFGNLLPGQSEDTETTSGLQPIIIRNDGNYPVNITVNASSFFVNSGGAYQFKIEDNETGSYDSAFTTYTDLNSTAQQAVTSLNYENSSNTGNTVNMHLTITVPLLEPAADKTSLIEISTG